MQCKTSYHLSVAFAHLGPSRSRTQSVSDIWTNHLICAERMRSNLVTGTVSLWDVSDNKEVFLILFSWDTNHLLQSHLHTAMHKQQATQRFVWGQWLPQNSVQRLPVGNLVESKDCRKAKLSLWSGWPPHPDCENTLHGKSLQVPQMLLRILYEEVVYFRHLVKNLSKASAKGSSGELLLPSRTTSKSALTAAHPIPVVCHCVFSHGRLRWQCDMSYLPYL